MTVVPRLRPYQGPALFSYGFRPFFLAGAIWAALAILLWLPLFFGRMQIPMAFSPVDWHAHEMLYGYLPAIITGFLLTAIPNWTGRLPLNGNRLIVLALAWLAGRLAVLVSAPIGPVAAGVIDCLFLLLVAAATAREVIAGRNWKNLPPVGLVLAFFAGNVLFHVEAWQTGSADYARRIGIAAAIALVALIGGRVIPSFTRNWLARQAPGRLPVPFGGFDKAALAASGVALVAWVALPDFAVTAALLLVAGVLHAIRLARWAGERALRNALLLILHVAYAFIPLGFLLTAASILAPQAVTVSAAVHAWTAGAIGVMTLAMMTRVSLGHTGRDLAAGWLGCAIYAAVIVAAVARIGASLDMDAYATLLLVAGVAWIAAFGLFAIGYGPMLMRPRVGAR
ncbi:NnrS family protein [Rhodopila globiformis]|uniref:Short-chain dehydrogenase n=1 Tax=Rhodopila globiformis TaxID=1071 RepID=A0A2S6MWC5_RHOGL|nr:NnrS family protein [Rhodopila globiformis]PPQ26659.1 short-chain dehydrogenase [Rhodopila globiformis]